MSNLTNILRFGWPYIRRYRYRFVAGALLGLLFSLANAIILPATNEVIKRIHPKDPEVGALSVNGVDNEPSKRVSKVSADGGVHKFVSILPDAERIQAWRSDFLSKLDPWLPKKGRSMDARQVMGLLLLFPLLMAVRGYTGYLSSYCLGWVSERVINDLQVDVLKKMQTLSVDYFTKSKLGDLTSRVQTDTAWLHRTLSLGLSDLIKEPSTVLFLFIALAFLDWQMTLGVMLLLPLCILPVIILGRKIRRASHRSVETRVSQSSLLLEMLSGIRVVKAFGLEQAQIDRYSHYARQLVRHGMKGVQAKELVNPIIETVTALIFGGLLVFLFTSERRFEDMLIFIGGLIAAFTPLRKIAGLHVLFEQSSAGVTRLAQILQEQPSVREPEKPLVISPFAGSITFERVSFAYESQEVLHQLDLEIRRGQRLGLAGESGSGKSTLLNLLFRFYDPTAGKILLDGIDLRSVRTSDLRQQMALVSQEVMLFDQTVAENIALGKLGVGREAIEAAAKAAFAHDFILLLPQGYDTRIGERGITLSVGQRQRLSIARAFVRDAPILVLDEATAALDSQSESEVQRAIDALAEHRTVICVAHRLSTLSNMDRIIVLDKGRIIEDGSFKTLLLKKGPFAAMAQKQGIQI